MPSAARNHIIGSGALVALHDRRDQHYGWARQVFARIEGPWLTRKPVLTEAVFQLEARPSRALNKLLRAGIVRLAFDLEVELGAVLNLVEKYTDVPMSLADACLVRMSEVLPDPLVITVESDFRVYRRHGRKVVPVLMP